MDTRLSLNPREQALTFELMEALTSSLELPEVHSRAHGVLSQLLRADYVVLCVSKPGQPSSYDWMAAQMPAALFACYPEMVAEDFVRDAVARRPNVVLRDSEMVPRSELERSPLYRHCRELGMPLEHVMAVRLDVNPDWHGSLTLYRERRQPFSERDQALLQRLTPILASTVRHCRMFGEVSTRARLLEEISHSQGKEYLVLAPPSTEKLRTAHAAELVGKWFAPSECGPSGLPTVLLERLAWLVRVGKEAEPGSDIWDRQGPERDLRVTFVPLPEQDGQRLWALVLQEIPHALPLPADWRLRLTPREAEIVECVLQNWDNKLIAHHFGLAVNTVKKHVYRSFNKLGVDRRSALVWWAAQRREPV